MFQWIWAFRPTVAARPKQDWRKTSLATAVKANRGYKSDTIDISFYIFL